MSRSRNSFILAHFARAADMMPQALIRASRSNINNPFAEGMPCSLGIVVPIAFAAMNAGMKIVSPFSAGGRYGRYRVGMADCVNIVGTVPLSANRADVLVVGGTTVTEAPGKRLCDDEDREYNTCCRIAECGKLPVLR